MSTGEGFIPGFSECVVAILSHLGCDAWVTTQPDVRGIQGAVPQAPTSSSSPTTTASSR